jgi:hypothetical protein
MDARTLAGLSKELHSRIRTFFDTPLGPDATPLEFAQAVLDAVEREVQPVARGRRVFPWRALTVRVLAPESSAAVVASTLQDLRPRILERLAEVRCEAPRCLDVDVECVSDAPASWVSGQRFDIAYVAAVVPGTLPDRGEAGQSSLPALHVSVLVGTASEPSCTFVEATVSIGRTADPTDDQGRHRRNRIAFLDIVDGVNETVGRAHARLRRDPATGEYRLFDEGSHNGTSILRDGEVIAVHRRDPRGVRVRSGDEIHLGRAILRVEIR